MPKRTDLRTILIIGSGPTGIRADLRASTTPGRIKGGWCPTSPRFVRWGRRRGVAQVKVDAPMHEGQDKTRG